MSSFSDFYREIHPRLVASLAAVCGDAELAADAADEAAVRALERWGRVSNMSNPAGWTYQVALNDLKRRGRRRELERVLLRREQSRAMVDGPAGEMWTLVAALPLRQRHAIALRHIAHMTEPEIGQVLGIPRGTVSSTLRSGYARLRQDLDPGELGASSPIHTALEHADD